MQYLFQALKNSKVFPRRASVLIVGIALGFLISQSRFVLLFDQDMQKAMHKFYQILYYINKDYADTINAQELTDFAISQIIKQLDPHSSYTTAQEQNLINAELEGRFTGLGLEFCLSQDTIYVTEPVAGGPAAKAGIQAGDQIICVNGQIWAGKRIPLSYILENLRGPQGSQVTLTIKRSHTNQLLEFTLLRANIDTCSINVAYMVTQEIGYIKLSRFTNRTYEEFMHAIHELKRQGMKKLLIDLQDNPGGYLDQAIKISEQLLAANKLILYTQGKNTKYSTQYYTQDNGALLTQVPIIVLINENSASASEILAGALQDHDRALLVGRCSFGKGLIQRPIQLADGSQLKLTVCRYYTPSGRFIQKPYKDKSMMNPPNLTNPYQQDQVEHDAIKQPVINKIAYKTAAGRTIYGGMGGIMPDAFVPLGSTSGDTYIHELVDKFVLQLYAIDYANTHKVSLSTMSYTYYYENFAITEPMLAMLYKKAQSVGISKPKQLSQKSKKEIQLLVKAYIARNIWQAVGFYPLLNQIDPIFQQAMQSFDQAETLLQITKPSS